MTDSADGWKFFWSPTDGRKYRAVLEPPNTRPDNAEQPSENPKLARSGLLAGPAFIVPVTELGSSVSDISKDDTTRSPVVHGRRLQR